MHSHTTTQFRFQVKTVIAVLVFAISGLLLLIASLQMTPGFWATLMNQLSTALLVGGIWTGIYEFFMRNDFVRMNTEQTAAVLDRIRLSEGGESIGLTDVYPDSSIFDFDSLLRDPPTLTILLNDGRTWVSTHSERLRARFSNPALRTTIFLLHPDSPMLQVLARKVGSSQESLRSKIAESIHMLKSLRSESTQLEILGHHLFNPHALFLSPDAAALTPYFAARGRRTVPLMRFRDNSPASFVHKLRDDMIDLRNDSESIIDYASPGPATASAQPLN